MRIDRVTFVKPIRFGRKVFASLDAKQYDLANRDGTMDLKGSLLRIEASDITVIVPVMNCASLEVFKVEGSEKSDAA